MGNILNFMAAAFLLVLLLAAQLFPASPFFWEASLTLAFTVLRYALVVIMLWFIIHPPKTKFLRVPLGLSALTLAAWVSSTTYQGTLGVIDFLSFGTATLAMFTTLLESKPKDEEFMAMRFLAAMSDWTFDKVRLVGNWAYQFGWLLMTDIDLSIEEYYRRMNSEERKSHIGSAVPTRSRDWTTNLRAGLMH